MVPVITVMEKGESQRKTSLSQSLSNSCQHSGCLGEQGRSREERGESLVWVCVCMYVVCVHVFVCACNMCLCVMCLCMWCVCCVYGMSVSVCV